ncbi:MAG: zinc ribbon domain-containing protein [Deltaproteobacteria bacterium]|nr:zinc ribbon domain-containing protein [Deltaproteobacteria bacterium]
MPIYEYRCNACGKKFDCVTTRISEKVTPQCPACNSTDAAKLVSRVRYSSGPREHGLASNAEKSLLRSMGGNVSDSVRKEIKQLADTASKRGKRRFESMMDTGKSESIEY